jgi:hypothetical protein
MTAVKREKEAISLCGCSSIAKIFVLTFVNKGAEILKAFVFHKYLIGRLQKNWGLVDIKSRAICKLKAVA